MSMPIISNLNPEINIVRDDAVNIIIASIAMEELALAHILNAEGEKLQYILGTLEGKDPGEVTICDIMEVSKSVHKTLKDVFKEELLLQLKLEDAFELVQDTGDCTPPNKITVSGSVIWVDANNVSGNRPEEITVTLLQNGVAMRTVTVTSPPDNEDTALFEFKGLPELDNNGSLYIYTVDENDLANYDKSIEGFIITNTLK